MLLSVLAFSLLPWRISRLDSGCWTNSDVQEWMLESKYLFEARCFPLMKSKKRDHHHRRPLLRYDQWCPVDHLRLTFVGGLAQDLIQRLAGDDASFSNLFFQKSFVWETFWGPQRKWLSIVCFSIKLKLNAIYSGFAVVPSSNMLLCMESLSTSSSWSSSSPTTCSCK